MATAKRQAGRDSRRKARGQRAGQARVAIGERFKAYNKFTVSKLRSTGFARAAEIGPGRDRGTKKLRAKGRMRVVGVRDTMRRSVVGPRITRAGRQLGLVRTETRTGTRQG